MDKAATEDLTSATEVDQEIDRVLDGIKSLDAESRDYLRPILREDVLESRLPGEAVLAHIRSRHEIIRGYVFPKDSGDDEAMFFLEYQVVIGQDFLRGLLEKDSYLCEHQPLRADGSRGYTLKERAEETIKLIEEQQLESAISTESTPQIEAAVDSFMERFAEVADEEQKKLIADAYRNRILSSTDPRMVIRRRLSRYETELGILDIPEEERLDRALKLLLVRLDFVSTALKLIATQDLSCGDHHVVYAGGVESEGNRIYTAQEVAQNTLEDLDRYLLEPRPVVDVLRELLASLTAEDS